MFIRQMLSYHSYPKAWMLESGEVLPCYTLAYQTFGTLSTNKDNVVWIIHALTANSNPLEWWPEVVGIGKAIDPEKHFIICANVLGSHYGSTSPLHVNPSTKKNYYRDFPLLTTRDLAKTYERLASHLQIDHIHLLVGASLGGQQAMQWAIDTSLTIDHLALIATNAKHSPYGIAFNESQRMAIETDPTYFEDNPVGGLNGMKTARSIALLSYRTAVGYNLTQAESSSKLNQFRASSYQRYQGEKLAKRFNAYSYHLFTRTMDAHDVSRGRGTIALALKQIKAKKTSVIGITSDILFTMEESQLLAENINNSTLYTIESEMGHDGFLTESNQVRAVLQTDI